MNTSTIEYSLDTPSFKTNINDNILNAKIFNLIQRDNNHIGGSNDTTNSDEKGINFCTTLIIGILMFIIGLYLYSKRDEWLMCSGTITKSICSDVNNMDSGCKICFKYNVSQTEYNKTIFIQPKMTYLNDVIKQIGLDKLFNTFGSNSISQYNVGFQIQIYYLVANPNIVRLYEINYEIIGLALMIVGGFLMIPSIISHYL